MKSFLALLLALILSMTGHTMAVARGHMAAARTVILCVGTGFVTVPLDSHGRPLGPTHVCPDCALTLFAPADTPPDPLLRQFAFRPLRFAVVRAVAPPVRQIVLPEARAPPVVV